MLCGAAIRYLETGTHDDCPREEAAGNLLRSPAWGTKDFYIEDPDGYIVCFGGRPTADWQRRLRAGLA